MKKQKPLPWIVAVGMGYAFLVAAIFYFLPAPWNFVVGALVLLKASIFIFAMVRASAIGAKKRPTPPT